MAFVADLWSLAGSKKSDTTETLSLWAGVFELE
jgi:hypothetical protein